MARPRVVAAAAATLGVAGAHNFILHEAPLSWPDAAVACRAAGGRLAKVEDAAEQAVLATTMGPSNWLTPDRAAAFPGCGGHAGESEPNDWGAGEDCMGAYEHCGLWFDANCADPRPDVCEHPEAAARAACPEGWRGVGGRCFGLAGSGPRDEASAASAVELAGAAAGAAGAAAAPTAAPTPRAVEAAPDASCPLAFVPAAGTWADAEATSAPRAGDCAGAGGAGGGVCSANPCPAGVCAGTFTCDDAARFGYVWDARSCGLRLRRRCVHPPAAAAAAEAAWAAPDADDGEAAVVESQCHAAACGEYGSGGVDDDCCAAPDDAFCAEGYVYAAGVVGCGRGFTDGRVSTCCIDPAAPAPGVDAGVPARAERGAAELAERVRAAAATSGLRDADDQAALERVAPAAPVWVGRRGGSVALERGRSRRWLRALGHRGSRGGDARKAYVCEYADDAGGGEKGPEAAAGGGMMAVVVAVVIVLALLGGGAAAYAAKRRRGHAARGYGDVARGYEPDSDLPSYGDYVLNPISVSAGV
ncbi:hypothetical protein JL721_8631 [Aureococcus anophagefferens]|nr:hypothetical protein JL721_8631 [Aureococcus anophagefferens]